MTSMSNKLVITFNGEIYNHLELRKRFLPSHKFRGSSDTETLVELIDLMGLQKTISLLHGMYAFSIYDTETNQISIVRDIPGEKPLYIMTSNHSLSFASDISNFKKLPDTKRNKL